MRCVEIGLSMADLEELDFGMVYDMFTEKANDSEEWDTINLKDVNKLLKMDPGNVELLRQKHELLGKAIKDTKERQEELKKALEAAKEAGDTEENRHQQDLLQRELIETTQNLENLEAQFDELDKLAFRSSRENRYHLVGLQEVLTQLERQPQPLTMHLR